ncbi:MAG: ABC transporter permease [Actinomycetota bacterium]
MNVITDALGWLTTADQWWGNSGIVNRTIEHVQYSLAAVVVAVLIALPPALVLGHARRFGTAAINIGNIGRAVPSFAILLIAQTVWGLDELPVAGPITVFVALVALGVPPILINAYTGMAEVPDSVREAATAMGFTPVQQVLRAELPVALPLIIAGIRTSTVQIIATATLGAVVGAGGLGRYIIDGLATRDFAEVMGGALLIAALAIVTELGFSLLQRSVISPGLRRRAVAVPHMSV